MRYLLLAFAVLLATPAAVTPAFGQDANTNRIIDQGTNHSQVMTTAQHLTDVIGPRLPNSPQMRAAEAWTEGKFREWGLTNVHREGFPFGRGWSIDRSSVRMTAPRPVQLTAIPIAWTPPTRVTAPVIVAPMRRERDFAKWRGQLRGKVVMVTRPTDLRDPTDPVVQRLSGEEIAKLDKFEQPRFDPTALPRNLRRADFPEKLDAFLKAEGAVAYATMSRLDGKLVHGEGWAFETNRSAAIPGVEIAAEDYRRLARLAKVGPAPTLEIESAVRFHNDDTQAYNILADIPGTDAKAGYVMAGAHLDSWVAGDGAADNAAGSAVVMEAARILRASGVRPKRAIRFALWNAEEEGLLGSIAYIRRHLATRGSPGDPQLNGDNLYYSFADQWPITPLPGHRDLAAYFNIDNGSGKIRGLYAERNPAVVSTLQGWLAPFASMGASSVVVSPTTGTDHVFMQSVGIPGFQFIQDPLDYDSRVHHTSVDTFDHLKADDLRQASIVLASVLLSAANADRPLPRPPLPTRPAPTDPLAYPQDEDE
ncbi:M20/M25/M40 family metallo-hydrolase [uncultured Sphingomonas sp.]|uniref:M20/M25/M40 family metallo-hydrolase n=1 Tax=uncultured Sphingomonas sp. TaxID=158754 RepID=UPI0035C9DA0F